MEPSTTIIIDTRRPFPYRPSPHIKEYWTGLHRQYRLRLHPGRLGHDMLRGEYDSLVAIDKYTYTSKYVPRPMQWGTLSQDRDLHFLLTHHHESGSQILSTERFVFTLAQFHLRSAYDSETFGFHITTYHGQIAQINRLRSKWEEYFAVNFQHILEIEKDIQGPHTPEMHALSNAVLQKVIPRLLRPMETGGRSIRPTLLHGDLTPANVSTSLCTRLPIVSSPCSFYGHNEYDLQAFVTGGFGSEALEMYHRLVPISEPRAEGIE